MLSEISSKFIKRTTVRTCVGLYDQLRLIQPKLYKNGPLDGVDLDVEYVDTWRPDKTFEKTIVAIHGQADTYHTYIRLIQHFQSTNVRIVVPNLPDFSHTRKTNFSFWHSTIEKYHYLKDLLYKLDIKTVDCLLGHSLGIQPCCALWENPSNIKIKALGIISPQFLLEKFNDREIKIGKFLLYFKSDLGTWILNWLKFYKSSYIPFKFTNMDQLFLLICILCDEQATLDAEMRIKTLTRIQTPGFISFGSNENLITKTSIDKIHRLLNINEKICIEDDDPNSLPKLPPNKITSFLFKDAGHFPHVRYSKVTNRLIEQLIE